MTSSKAWCMQIDDSLSVALGDHEMVEYIQSPMCFPVPGAPYYCTSVLLWQDNLVPLMDIAALFGRVVDDTEALMCIVNYQLEAGAGLQQIGLRIAKAPEKIDVDDDQFCELEESVAQSLLFPVALSCFIHQGREVVVLNIAKLCSAEFRELANST